MYSTLFLFGFDLFDLLPNAIPATNSNCEFDWPDEIPHSKPGSQAQFGNRRPGCTVPDISEVVGNEVRSTT